MRLGKIGFRHLSHNKQNGQLTCSSVQTEQFQWCTRLFFMDLSVQIDLTLVVKFISLLIFCVWSFINLMRFHIVKIWTPHKNCTAFATAFRNTYPALLRRNTCHIRSCSASAASIRPKKNVAELDGLHTCFQTFNMTSSIFQIKTILSLQSSAQSPSLAIFLLMLQGISFVMIYTQSRFHERRPWRR